MDSTDRPKRDSISIKLSYRIVEGTISNFNPEVSILNEDSQSVIEGREPETLYFRELETSLGYIVIASDNVGIRCLEFCNKGEGVEKILARMPEKNLVEGEAEQLEDVLEIIESLYGKSKRRQGGIAGKEVRSVYLHLKGTPFRLRVWEALLKIGWGRTATYGDIARRMGSDRGCRGVGGAVSANSIALLIPCHRVIPAVNPPGNYRWGREMKELLLEKERQQG